MIGLEDLFEFTKSVAESIDFDTLPVVLTSMHTGLAVFVEANVDDFPEEIEQKLLSGSIPLGLVQVHLSSVNQSDSVAASGPLHQGSPTVQRSCHSRF